MAEFRRVIHWKGFDRFSVPHYQMVPMEEPRYVMLRDGKGLTVASSKPAALKVTEVNAASLPAGDKDPIWASDRIFKLEGQQWDIAFLEARTGAGIVAASLECDIKNRRNVALAFNFLKDAGGHTTNRQPAASTQWLRVINGIFNGNALEFAEFIIPMLQSMRCTMHRISNTLIQIDGDRAAVETYVEAYHLADGENGAQQDIVVGGRYVDRFERRGGEWRIAHRTFVHDWNQNPAATVVWDGPLYGKLDVRGRRDRDDPSYALFGAL